MKRKTAMKTKALELIFPMLMNSQRKWLAIWRRMKNTSVFWPPFIGNKRCRQRQPTIKRHVDVTHIVVGCRRVGFYFIISSNLLTKNLSPLQKKKKREKSFLFRGLTFITWFASDKGDMEWFCIGSREKLTKYKLHN